MNDTQKCFKRLLFILIVVLSFLIIGCCKDKDSDDDILNNNDEITIEHTMHTLLTGSSLSETKVHIFKSNVHGPKVAIVGGIHGDEVAGWKFALQLLEKKDFKGEVLIIPQANYLATKLEKRYPGQGSNGIYHGITYSDLNRTFPGSLKGTITEKMAYAIIQTLEFFSPSYIIDLHESLTSYDDLVNPRTGNSLIYTNQKTALFVENLVYEFNHNYKKENEKNFTTLYPAVKNTFNYYCSKNFDAIVFTIETHRNLELTRRIEQQSQLIDLFFKTIWE